ncbi:hypothetical protein A6E15_19370 [Natrinema saccharevitans]|uniref:Uncharacterized protein n=1 Tax=Natrinema saccharevitans TaxID=301967 RepID=A0A1S8AQW7_9EURY|nr:hypothetical protein [Natrinema saccharevitans]OLZ39125.1 hypothetical protein A6E15_19370 [Natrinema saccharevitans]
MSDRFADRLFDPINTVEPKRRRDLEVEQDDERMFCPDGLHYTEPANGTHPEQGPTDYCSACDCWTLYESRTQFIASEASALGFELSRKTKGEPIDDRGIYLLADTPVQAHALATESGGSNHELLAEALAETLGDDALDELIVDLLAESNGRPDASTAFLPNGGDA